MRHFPRPSRTGMAADCNGVRAVAVAALGGCSSLTPIEKLVIAQDAEPLLAQIRAGEVGINEPLPWGGAFGVEPSFFTPLCAAAFGGALAALDELLALGADVDAECGPAITPLDLVMRHPSARRAVAMGKLLQAVASTTRPAPGYLVHARM